MSKQEVILCESLETSLGRAIELCPHDKLFVLTDEHTQRLCLPSLKESGLLKDAVEICIGAEDVHKTLETLDFRLDGIKHSRGYPPLFTYQSWRRDGDRSRRFCRSYIQTGHFLYQYTNHPARHGGRISGG